MNTGFRSEMSLNGYKLSVLKSGLQKYIRRGEIANALYCAGELDLFGEMEGGEHIRTNFLNRLLVILLEDVGNLALIDELCPRIIAIKADRTATTSADLNQIITKMCLSEKSRTCSHIKALFDPKNEALLKLFDVQLDIAIRKKMTPEELGSEFEELLIKKDIACVKYALALNFSEDKLAAPYQRSRKPVYLIFKILSAYVGRVGAASAAIAAIAANIGIVLNLHKKHIGHLKEGFLCWMVPVLCIIGAIQPMSPLPELPPVINAGWSINRQGEQLIFDEYVYDMHTGNKSTGRVEFATEGSKVTNEAPWVCAAWKNIYIYSKYLAEGRESDIPGLADTAAEQKVDAETSYSFVVRTQLVTSRSKMDVYFAEKNDKLYVIKGPYSDEEPLRVLQRVTAIKQANGIPFVTFRIEKLLPDRWAVTPLGNRNRVDLALPQFFIVFDSLIKKEQIEIKTRKSKLWPNTEVVDWDKVPLHLNFKSHPLSDDEMARYIDMLVFRYVLGISDLADRNFIRLPLSNSRGTIISIDEDISGQHVNLRSELKKNRCEAILQWLSCDEKFILLRYAAWQIDQADLIHQLPTRRELEQLFK